MRRCARALTGASVVASFACAPEWQDDGALITRPRIVAITVEPPEAAPGAPIALAALVATPEGPASLPVAWSFCRSPKPLAENGAVNPACLGDDLPALGPPGPTAAAPLPGDACRLFGPETPPRAGDAPPQRPRDPDTTGGYYQPVRASLAGETVVAPARIVCNLATAPLEVAADFRQRYRPNQNPAAPEITALAGGVEIPLNALPAGQPITLVARWSADSAERYLAFDPLSQALVERREALRVSWFVTAGTIARPRVGRGEADPETSAETSWRAQPPLVRGTRVHLWAVLQDSRGGLAASHRVLGVE